jgi:hypothetical protein
MMGTQLSLPAGWAFAATSRRDPGEQLEQLARDKLEAKAEIREVLDRLAAKHGASARDIGYAIEGYADDMIDDALFEVERELNTERAD